MWRYLLREMLAAFRARPLVTVLLVLMIAAGLVGTELLLSRIAAGENWWAERFADSYLEVYLAPETTEDEGYALRDALRRDSRISEAIYVTAEDARREAEQYLGSIVFTRLSENPLPPSIRLYPQRDARKAVPIELLADSLALLPAVTEMTYPREHIELYDRGQTLLTDYRLMVTIAALGWIGLVMFVGMLLLRRAHTVRYDIWWYLGVGPGVFRRFALVEGFLLAVIGVGLAMMVILNLGETDIPSLIALIGVPNGWVLLPLAAGIVGGIAGWLGQRVRRGVPGV